MAKVPFIDLTRYESGFIDGVKREVSEALDKAQFVGGPQIEALEKDLRDFTGANEVVSCANGTDALQLALRAAGIKNGDKVLLPEMTFWATVEAVFNVGATPVCIDVSDKTLHLSLSDIKKAHEKEKVQALMLVHLYGWAAPDTLAIRKYCSDQGIVLVEDSAQAFGTKLGDQDLIGSAEIASTSFYPAKVLGASGDAGALFFKDKALAQKARMLSNHGRISHYQHGGIGWNSRIGVYEAIFLRHSLRHLKTRIASRRHCVDEYRKRLVGISALQLGKPDPAVFENGYLSVVRVDAGIRDKLRTFLSEQGIGTGVVYPEPMSLQPAYKEVFPQKTDPKNALSISRTMINLPCFPGITQEEITQSCDLLREFFS